MLFAVQTASQPTCLPASTPSPLLVPPAGTPEQPFLLVWTPDASTPGLLYYQCTVHQKLGWEVRVVDAA